MQKNTAEQNYYNITKSVCNFLCIYINSFFKESWTLWNKYAHKNKWNNYKNPFYCRIFSLEIVVVPTVQLPQGSTLHLLLHQIIICRPDSRTFVAIGVHRRRNNFLQLFHPWLWFDLPPCSLYDLRLFSYFRGCAAVVVDLHHVLLAGRKKCDQKYHKSPFNL